MRLWMSSETSYTALTEEQCNLLRVARNEVETLINQRISGIDYAIPLDSWDCIVVMMGADSFEERVVYSFKKRNMDFRLKLDSAAFNEADEIGRQRMVFQMLMRSLDLLNQKLLSVKPKLEVSVFDELERLRCDVLSVAEMNRWVENG